MQLFGVEEERIDFVCLWAQMKDEDGGRLERGRKASLKSFRGDDVNV